VLVIRIKQDEQLVSKLEEAVIILKKDKVVHKRVSVIYSPFRQCLFIGLDYWTHCKMPFQPFPTSLLNLLP